MSRETKIEGEPSQIRAASTWLRTSMAAQASTFADTVYAQRSRVTSAWWSEAGEAFAAELGHLGDAADQVSQVARTCATELDVLAAALDGAHEEMARARSTAAHGGLVVSGTVIHEPGPPPPDVPALGGDATPSQRAAHADGVAAIDAYDATVAAWNEAVGIADAADRQWQAAVEQLAASWQQAAGRLEAPFAVLFAGGADQDETNGFGQAVQQLLGSQFLNIFGFNDGFPIIPLGVAAGKMWRMGQVFRPSMRADPILPIFQTGLVGKTLLGRLEKQPGKVGSAATWLKSPAGIKLTRGLGVLGGVGAPPWGRTICTSRATRSMHSNAREPVTSPTSPPPRSPRPRPPSWSPPTRSPARWPSGRARCGWARRWWTTGTTSPRGRRTPGTPPPTRSVTSPTVRPTSSTTGSTT